MHRGIEFDAPLAYRQTQAPHFFGQVESHTYLLNFNFKAVFYVLVKTILLFKFFWHFQFLKAWSKNNDFFFIYKKFIYVCMYVCMYVCIHPFLVKSNLYTYVCMYVCMYVSYENNSPVSIDFFVYLMGTFILDNQ